MRKGNQTSQSNILARRIVTISFSVAVLLSTATANANLLGNPGFETGDTREWEVVGAVEHSRNAGAVDYETATGDEIITLYDGGTYGGFRRTGEAEEKGYSQTVRVVPGVKLTYSLDFVAREVLIPTDGRGNQAVSLWLNGVQMREDGGAAPSVNATNGHFSGSFTPSIDTVTFTMTSLREDGLVMTDHGVVHFWNTGHAQVYFDNANLECAESDTCIRDETTVAPNPIPTMSTYGFILMILGLLFIVARRLRNTAGSTANL
jgi:hypothetical protein